MCVHNSNPTIVNCVFSGNLATGSAGGASGGGLSINTANPTLINCTVAGNLTTVGGGAAGMGSRNEAIVTLSNCVFWDNRAAGATDRQAQLDWNKSVPFVQYSCIQGGWTFGGEGNIDLDPQFVDADGSDGIVGTPDDDLRLLPGSPCIDVGHDAALPADTFDLDDDGDTTEPLPFDLGGSRRILGSRVDMGAHEFEFEVLVWTLTITASPEEGGTVTGTGAFDEQADAPLTAIANEGYRFAGWTGEGIADPNAASTTISMTGDRNVTASFVKVWTLTIAASPEEGGTVTGTGAFDDQADVPLTAIANEGYRFAGWTGEGVADPNAASTTVSMTGDRNLVVRFESAAVADEDEDGIPDAWEDEFGLDRSDPTDATADFDGDGMSNHEEFTAMTDPRDPTSLLRITEFKLTESNQVRITWQSVPGIFYAIETSENMAPLEWSLVDDSAVEALEVSTSVSFEFSTQTAAYFRVIVVAAGPSAPSGMALIPAGPFEMGDSFNEGNGDELPVHTVHVSAFYMDSMEVTKALWDEVRAWGVNNGYTDLPAGDGKAADHPVHSVDWYDVVKWCNARSEKEGRTPAYYTSTGQTTVYRSGEVDVQNDWVKWNVGHRLPTEAEWEKAARGGASGRRFPWGDTITHSQANYNSGGPGGPPDSVESYDVSPTRGNHPSYQTGGEPYTSPVGSFAANGYGLYDMAGNAWEWCWDWYSGTYYGSSPGTDPRGPRGSRRVVRGGSWGNCAFCCRSANRFNFNPANWIIKFGFRSVLSPGQ